MDYELLTKAGVITRLTCVVEHDSSGVMTQKWNSELWRGSRDIYIYIYIYTGVVSVQWSRRDSPCNIEGAW